MKPLRHLLIVAYMLGMMHEFIPHEHHGEARDSAILVSEDPAAECGSLWRHLLKALGALEHPSTGAEFHFFAPDEAAADKAPQVGFSAVVLPQAVVAEPTSASLDVTVAVHFTPGRDLQSISTAWSRFSIGLIEPMQPAAERLLRT